MKKKIELINTNKYKSIIFNEKKYDVIPISNLKDEDIFLNDIDANEKYFDTNNKKKLHNCTPDEILHVIIILNSNFEILLRKKKSPTNLKNKIGIYVTDNPLQYSILPSIYNDNSQNNISISESFYIALKNLPEYIYFTNKKKNIKYKKNIKWNTLMYLFSYCYLDQIYDIKKKIYYHYLYSNENNIISKMDDIRYTWVDPINDYYNHNLDINIKLKILKKLYKLIKEYALKGNIFDEEHFTDNLIKANDYNFSKINDMFLYTCPYILDNDNNIIKLKNKCDLEIKIFIKNIIPYLFINNPSDYAVNYLISKFNIKI